LTRAFVPFDALASGHRARYRYDPIPDLLTRAERLRRLWRERLAHYVKGLPQLDDVLRDVRSIVNEQLPIVDES
jgi:hypothetical protein